MAVTKVVSIVARAEKVLQDESAVRWTRLELQDWINAAYQEIVLMRPDANALTANVMLTAGSRQKLPSAEINLPSALRVIDVIRNVAVSSTKRAVRLIDRRIMDDQIPDWSNATGSVNIQHWMFDPRLPKEFMVYPPATALAQLEIAYSQVPAGHTLDESALGNTATAETIKLDDIYANAILDYVLYRAYSKDADYAANGARANNHYTTFRQSLGDKTAVDLAMSPANVTPSTAKTTG